MDGALDWYVLGVVFGLGVAAGAALVGALRAPAWVALAVVAGVGALVLVLRPPPVVDDRGVRGGRCSLGSSRLRRLSAEALPAAVLGRGRPRRDPAPRATSPSSPRRWPAPA